MMGIEGKFVLVFALLLMGICLVVVNAQSAIEWHSDQEGMQIAGSQNKSAMIFFYSNTCSWCEKEKEVFKEGEVIEMSKNFVPIIGTERLAREYRISGVPVILFTNSQGGEVYRIVGYRDADMLLKEMRQALKSSNSPLQSPQNHRQAQTPGFGVVTAIAAIFMCVLGFKRRYVK